jgi:hypothetical protein
VSQSNPEWSYDDFDKNAKRFGIRLIDYIKEKITANVEPETVQLELKSWLFNREQADDLPLLALNPGVYDSILSMLNTSGGLIVIGIKQNGEFAKLLFEIADVAEKITLNDNYLKEFTNFKKAHPATWSEDLQDNERDILEGHYERTAQRKIVDYIAKNTNFKSFEVEEFLKIAKARYKYKSANESLLLIFITPNEDGKLLWQHHSKFIKDNKKSEYLTRVRGQNLQKSRKEVDNRLEIYNKTSPATYGQIESLKEELKKLSEAHRVTEKAAKESAAAQKILDDGKATAAEKEKAETVKKDAEFTNIEKSIYFRTLLEDILRNQNEYYADTMSRFNDFERQTKGEHEEFIPEGLSPEDELLTHKNLLKKLKEIRDTGSLDQDKKRKIEDQIKKLEGTTIPYFEKEIAKQQKGKEDPITVTTPDSGGFNGSGGSGSGGSGSGGSGSGGSGSGGSGSGGSGSGGSGSGGSGSGGSGSPGTSSMPAPPRGIDWKIVVIILGILAFALIAMDLMADESSNQSPIPQPSAPQAAPPVDPPDPPAPPVDPPDPPAPPVDPPDPPAPPNDPVPAPDPEPPTCTLPEILENGICVDPTPDPEPPTCTLPEILENGICVDPTPDPEPELLVSLSIVNASLNVEFFYEIPFGERIWFEGTITNAQDRRYPICVIAMDPNVDFENPDWQEYVNWVVIVDGMTEQNNQGNNYMIGWIAATEDKYGYVFPWSGNEFIVTASICERDWSDESQYERIIVLPSAPPPPAPDPPAPEPATAITLEQNKRFILKGTSSNGNSAEQCNTYVQTAAEGNYEPTGMTEAQDDKTIFFGQMHGAACAKSTIAFDLNSVLDKLDDNNIDSIELSFISLNTGTGGAGDNYGCGALRLPLRSGSNQYKCHDPDSLGAELKYHLSENANCAASNKELFESQEGWTDVTSWSYTSPDSTQETSADISQIKDDIDSSSNRYLCVSFTDEVNTSGDNALQENYRLHALGDIQIKFNFVLQ